MHCDFFLGKIKKGGPCKNSIKEDATQRKVVIIDSSTEGDFRSCSVILRVRVEAYYSLDTAANFTNSDDSCCDE